MHIFFSCIGGTGIGPLALIAKQAGYEVSGSDKQDSQYIDYLRSHGINNIQIDQTEANIAEVNEHSPIDWFVYSSALTKENPNHTELEFIKSQNIKYSKRDMFLNYLLKEKNLKLLAVAGTHGKSTTTAMAIWLMKCLNIPISYSVGAKISFGDMGKFDEKSEYFIYECDEFDRNFLAFSPFMSLITGVSWDHHEVYKTIEDYRQAFRDFMAQSQHNIIWQEEVDLLGLLPDKDDEIIDNNDIQISKIKLAGLVNRQNAWQVVIACHKLTAEPIDKLIEIMNRFPGLSRRMEKITTNLYSDYAHTPEKIVGAMGVALETAQNNNQKVVVIYEPLTNRRMNYMRDQHRDVFKGASTIYWVPSYLAREDPSQVILSPEELIKSLSPDLQTITEPKQLNNQFKELIKSHLDNNHLVIAMSGGGGNSLDAMAAERI